MKRFIVLLLPIIVLAGILNAQPLDNDLSYLPVKARGIEKTDSITSDSTSIIKQTIDLDIFFKNKYPAYAVLGYTKQNRPVEVYYFPGNSKKRALIIGGIHGSELSSIEIADSVIDYLLATKKPYYNVVIIPSLFPDNAETAKTIIKEVELNTGRYTDDSAVDPNRQMPALAKAFDPDNPLDYNGRLIEKENQLLLQLIQQFSPSRIINIHAIRDTLKGGVYADPRTDCNSIAMGFETDSNLAITMAKYINDNDGNVWGNNLLGCPTALYYTDPDIASVGGFQRRNLNGSSLPNNRGCGVSLGSWATTAVCDKQYHRNAIRLITMEFPGYKSSSCYLIDDERNNCIKNIRLYALSVINVFLNNLYCEE
jgi:hypothetical protein